MSTRGIRALIEDYEAMLTNEKCLMNGRFYHECSEAEKNHLSTLLDIARMTENALILGKELSEGAKDYLVFTLLESTLLNGEVSSKLPVAQQRQLFDEAEKFLKKIEPVLGKKYVDLKIRQFELLKSRVHSKEERSRTIVSHMP